MRRVNMFFVLMTMLCIGQLASAQPGVTPDKDTGRTAQYKMLTAEQRTKISAILKESRVKILAVLTPEQQQKLKELTGGVIQGFGARIASALATLKLTDEQQTKIKTIQDAIKVKVKNVKADRKLTALEKQQKVQAFWFETIQPISGILTPEQRLQFAEAMRKSAPATGRDALIKSLKLTEAQQTKYKVIQDNARKRIEEITADAGLTAAEKQQRMQRIVMEAATQLLQILTPEQQQQYKAQIAVQRGGWRKVGEVFLKQLNPDADQQMKIGAIKEKAVTSIRAVLDADQQQVFDKLNADQRELLLQQVDAQNGDDEDEE